jgi:hypothetical protein
MYTKSMPNPPECQPIADAIASLSAQEENQLAALPGLSGVAKWKAMETLGTIRQQIAQQQALLADCIKSHPAGLTTQVSVTDLTGNSGPNRIARMWQLTAAGQAVKQTATVQNGAATFAMLAGSRQSFGITIEETDHPAVNGPDFRSGPLPATADPNAIDPASHIEIVILDSIVITADTLKQAAPPLPLQLSFPVGPAVTAGITVSDLQFTVNDGEISLTATGTATAAGTNSPFTFSNTFHLVPSFGMAPSGLVEILSGVPPSLTVSGLMGTVVHALAPLVASSLSDQAIKPLASLLNRTIGDLVASALGLPSIPFGSVLSIRQLTVGANGITVVPALGAFGATLSAFEPSAPSGTANVATLDIKPSSLSTSDPAATAQGRITLDAAAPAGGLTVVLSCDRSDLIKLDPASVLIAAGGNSAVFTASVVPQPIMPAAMVDATVSASLGTKTVTARLSIKPQPPATTPPLLSYRLFSSALNLTALGIPSGGPFSLGIDQIYLGGYPVRNEPVQGAVDLGGPAPSGGTTVVVTFLDALTGQAAIIPQTISVPAGARTATFTFTIPQTYTPSTLVVLVRVEPYALGKYVEVPVY